MFLSVLDSVETVMTGQAVYDRQQFQSIVSALTRFDPQLYHSQENGWRGLIAYYQEWKIGGEELLASKTINILGTLFSYLLLFQLD